MRFCSAHGLAEGLSPRVRGNRFLRSSAAAAPGSIPARAGEPGPGALSNSGAEVYPRACGGTRMIRSLTSSGGRLSPRVRGNRFLRSSAAAAPGSIPARAGEPGPGALSNSGAEVYPRACGGTRMIRSLTSSGGRLSPRVRGNPLGFCQGPAVVWSIPARAGEPAGCGRRRPATWVYPRACGGTPKPFVIGAPSPGLSPRVRGNPRFSLPPSSMSRSIPARAGEPQGCDFPFSSSGVYPRACGGTGQARP